MRFVRPASVLALLLAATSASAACRSHRAAAVVVQAVPVVAVQSFAVPSVAVLATPIVAVPVATPAFVTPTVFVTDVVHPRGAAVRVNAGRVRVRVR